MAAAAPPKAPSMLPAPPPHTAASFLFVRCTFAPCPRAVGSPSSGDIPSPGRTHPVSQISPSGFLPDSAPLVPRHSPAHSLLSCPMGNIICDATPPPLVIRIVRQFAGLPHASRKCILPQARSRPEADCTRPMSELDGFYGKPRLAPSGRTVSLSRSAAVAFVAGGQA